MNNKNTQAPNMYKMEKNKKRRKISMNEKRGEKLYNNIILYH